MAEHPYTILSAAMSIDGYLDSPGTHRLSLSNAADLARVDALRASCDAVLVGAETVRRDDPRLLIRSPQLRRRRRATGLPSHPVRVTLTRDGLLPPAAALFTTAEADTLVFAPTCHASRLRTVLPDRITVVDAGTDLDLGQALDELYRRGVRRLLVEGGAQVHTQLLAAGLVDELQLVVAPLFVGDGRATRLVGDGAFPWHAGHRASLVEVRAIGDVVLLRYDLAQHPALHHPVEPQPARLLEA